MSAAPALKHPSSDFALRTRPGHPMRRKKGTGFAEDTSVEEAVLSLLDDVCETCGGHGNISVTANVAPRLMHELCVAAMAGQVEQAMAIQRKLLPLHKALFVESNPIPVKWAVARMGLSGGTLRLPLTPLTPPSQQMLEQVMQAVALI